MNFLCCSGFPAVSNEHREEQEKSSRYATRRSNQAIAGIRERSCRTYTEQAELVGAEKGKRDDAGYASTVSEQASRSGRDGDAAARGDRRGAVDAGNGGLQGRGGGGAATDAGGRSAVAGADAAAGGTARGRAGRAGDDGAGAVSCCARGWRARAAGGAAGGCAARSAKGGTPGARNAEQPDRDVRTGGGLA